MKDPIFEPIFIGKVQVKNRLCMPAMHLNMAENYQVTDRIIDFYAERARGGAGMITAGYATVDALSGNTLNIGAHADEFIPGLQKLAAAIRENGAVSAIQLNHAGRYNMSFFLNGKQPVAPSSTASRLTGETPKELTDEEIEGIIGSFASAALRVKTAGFDAVEILSGTGYLISQFLSPITNQRNDKYGGSFENRMRFGLEIVKAMRQAVGADFPIIVRMNGNEFMPGGLTSRDLRIYAARLEDSSVNALCINVGWHEAKIPQIVSSVPRGAFSYLSRNIKETVRIPVIASHRINDPAIAREMIADGMCDMAAIGRGLIADPYFTEKARTGREHEIIHCIACAQGCFDNLFKLKSVECLCNPRAGQEKLYPPSKSARSQKVVIIGGGAAGMSAAIAATDRGHAVTLFEATNRLGGQLHIAGAPPGRQEFVQLAHDLENQISLRKIKVVLNTSADEHIIQQESPDIVILATGALPITPDIPGINQPHVVQAWDVLKGKTPVGKRTAIIGGGAVGVETALFLAEKGTINGDVLKFLFVNKAEDTETLYQAATIGTKHITLIEMTDKTGRDIGKSTRWAMLQDISRSQIKILTSTKAVEITSSGVKTEKEGKISEIPADTVIIGAGSVSYQPLAEKLQSSGIPLFIIGDAQKPGKALEAVHTGFITGYNL